MGMPVVRTPALTNGHPGDSHASPGMVEFGKLIEEIHPGIFIHSVYIEEELDQDRKAGFVRRAVLSNPRDLLTNAPQFGNVNEQIGFVAEQIANVTELKDGFDAIGFSQAGQFLRAYVERYNSPPVHNLITFGAQHMGMCASLESGPKFQPGLGTGVSDIPACRPWDLMCQAARRAARSSVYSHWAQTNIIQVCLSFPLYSIPVN